ncbi:MAG: DUF3467 domain-containing protein [Anaerolineae bacterium]|nr:DUF3467 domain-containing protein [Anaerolineae bacterium]
MTQPSGPQPMRINIELPADLEPTYANFALISHTPSELVVDFARIMPNTPTAKVHTRIVLTPMNAKLLHRALAENLQKFEEKYGEIKTPHQNIMIDRERGFMSP